MAASAASSTLVPPGSVTPPSRRLRDPLATVAQTMPEKANIEPTERSMPAVRMTKVMPTARIPMKEIWRITLKMLNAERKFGRSTERMITRTARKIRGANRPRIDTKSAPLLASFLATA
jgi:hypothetical protein